jgi:hypothetical protein
VTFSTPFCGYVIFGSTFEAYFKEKPSLLGYLFFNSICNRHLLSCKRRADFKFSLYVVQVRAKIASAHCSAVTAVTAK